MTVTAEANCPFLFSPSISGMPVPYRWPFLIAKAAKIGRTFASCSLCELLEMSASFVALETFEHDEQQAGRYMLRVFYAFSLPLIIISASISEAKAAVAPMILGSILHLGHPSRVCVYSEVEQPVIEALSQRTDPAIMSIKYKNFNSQIEGEVRGSLLNAGLPLHDPRGAPIIRGYDSSQAALHACNALSNGILAYVRVNLSNDGKPYKLTAVIARSARTRSMTFVRNALAILQAYDRSLGPIPGPNMPPALLTGPLLSADGDVALLFANLLKQVNWNES